VALELTARSWRALSGQAPNKMTHKR